MIRSPYAPFFRSFFWRKRLTARQEYLLTILTDHRDPEVVLLAAELQRQQAKMNVTVLLRAPDGEKVAVVGRVICPSRILTDFGISPIFMAVYTHEGLRSARPAEGYEEAIYFATNQVGQKPWECIKIDQAATPMDLKQVLTYLQNPPLEEDASVEGQPKKREASAPVMTSTPSKGAGGSLST